MHPTGLSPEALRACQPVPLGLATACVDGKARPHSCQLGSLPPPSEYAAQYHCLVPELGGEGGVALGSCAEACPSLILQASLLPLASISNEFLIKKRPGTSSLSQGTGPSPALQTPTPSGDCSVLERGQQRLTALREDDSVHF